MSVEDDVLPSLSVMRAKSGPATLGKREGREVADAHAFESGTTTRIPKGPRLAWGEEAEAARAALNAKPDELTNKLHEIRKLEESNKDCNIQLEELKIQMQEMEITTTTALAKKDTELTKKDEAIANLQEVLDAATAEKDLATETANMKVEEVALGVAKMIADSKTNAAKIANGKMKAAAKTSGEKDANAHIAELIAKMNRMNEGEIQLGFGICEGKDSNNINNWTTITSIKSFKKGNDIIKDILYIYKFFTPKQNVMREGRRGGTKKNKPNQKSDKKQTKKNKKKK